MTANYMEKILIVDDEKNVLEGLKRFLRTKFNILTAESGHLGLQKMEKEGPFAVVVSDMRMPEMNGIQFLAKVSELHPDTVRVMLTGNADLNTAMHAVNEGNIFRFLLKPCEKATIEWALEDAIRQYRLVMAERDLLENTLYGSVRVLSDILELVNPIAFSRTSRIRNYVHQICQHLKIKDTWQYELAAMLSQIGCVAIPSDTLSNIYAEGEVSEKEQQMFKEHPNLGKQLLSQIPRLEKVSEMVLGQQKDLMELGLEGSVMPSDPGILGAQILRIAIDFDNMISQGQSGPQAISRLKNKVNNYHAALLAVLPEIRVAHVAMISKIVDIRSLNDVMILANDLYTRSGSLLAAKGQQMGLSIRRLLRNYVERGEIDEKIRVLVPASNTNERRNEKVQVATP